MLSACGQKRDRDPIILDTKADAGRVEDEFGKGFGEAYRANPNAEPRNVQDGDLKPVSSTSEPVPIN